MVTAYIGLGSNLGNCLDNLQQAWKRLGEISGVTLLSLSSPYRSAPVGMESENWFINAVGSLQTTLQPEELLAEMLAVETIFGRTRGQQGKPEDRTVDLDLLYWGEMVCKKTGIVLPHPQIANRLFVLLPLAEIGPDVKHPVSRKTTLEMLDEFMRKEQAALDQEVRRVSWIECGKEVGR